MWTVSGDEIWCVSNLIVYFIYSHYCLFIQKKILQITELQIVRLSIVWRPEVIYYSKYNVSRLIQQFKEINILSKLYCICCHKSAIKAEHSFRAIPMVEEQKYFTGNTYTALCTTKSIIILKLSVKWHFLYSAMAMKQNKKQIWCLVG